MITGLLRGLLDVYKLAIIAYFIIDLLHVPANKWTEMLRSIIEPVREPIRKLLARCLPAQWQITDWSLLAMFLLTYVVQWLL